MNVTEMLGLQDERMEAFVMERWAAWVALEPRLGVVDDPVQLDAWRRRVEPTVANGVLLGLARLAAFDGGDDVDALVLAWLLVPSALRVRRRLGPLSERLDEVLAAQLRLGRAGQSRGRTMAGWDEVSGSLSETVVVGWAVDGGVDDRPLDRCGGPYWRDGVRTRIARGDR